MSEPFTIEIYQGRLGERAIQAACDELDVAADDVRAGLRHRTATLARHVAAYVVRSSGRSWNETARELGYADHTSAIAAVAHVKRLIASGDRIASVVDRVRLAIAPREAA